MKAAFSVTVAGQDISAALNPILISLTVSDQTGSISDTATIEVDDTGGQIVLPKTGDPIVIKLGWDDKGVGTIFAGKVDGVSASGGRSGRTLSIQAKGMDTKGKAKQHQRRHWDDTTLAQALSDAGEIAGISIKVDPSFASITRAYIALDDESFLAFGQRVAQEVGGTFKIVGDTAVLAKRNGGINTAGQSLSAVTAQWGVNLHSYQVNPSRGRPIHKKTRTRFFHSQQAEWLSADTDTGTDGGETTSVSRFSQPDKESANDQSSSEAVESDRQSGDGTVTIEGNIDAQPEGICILIGCRAGIDGTYRIDGVDHSYSRSGFITTLQLKQPKGAAGKDDR